MSKGLIHWPGLLRLLVDNYQPLQSNGSLAQAIKRLTVFVEENSPALSNYADRRVKLPEPAIEILDDYIGQPPSVCRMCTVGRSALQWLQSSDWPENE